MSRLPVSLPELAPPPGVVSPPVSAPDPPAATAAALAPPANAPDPLDGLPEATSVAVRLPGGRVYSPEEDEAHAGFIGSLLVRVASRSLIRQAFLGKFQDASRARFDEVWGRMTGALRVETDVDSDTAKPRQIARLEAFISEAKADKKFAVAVRAEALLADLYGSRAPTKVEANVSVKGAFTHLVSTLDDASVNKMLARARERRQLAEAATDAGLAPALLTTGTPVDDPNDPQR